MLALVVVLVRGSVTRPGQVWPGGGRFTAAAGTELLESPFDVCVSAGSHAETLGNKTLGLGWAPGGRRAAGGGSNLLREMIHFEDQL